MTTLEQALEPKPCDMGQMCLDCQPRGANGECPDQQPKQEPVAWLDEERNIIYMHNTHKTDDYHGFKRTTPLYTEPPKREWVGLTDEEIENLCWTEMDRRLLSFARAIENKLKEKNA